MPLTPGVSANQSIFVTASPEPGRYTGPTYVTITASEPTAQIWYTCRRNGTPADLLKYEKSILLTKSCALNYFAYTDTQNESKIERTDYTILYSDAVKLETTERILSLKNTSTETVDVGGWSIIAGTGSVDIPGGTTILPGARYEIGRVDPRSYELKSPEGYIKSSLLISEPARTVPPPKIVVRAPIPTPVPEQTEPPRLPVAIASWSTGTITREPELIIAPTPVIAESTPPTPSTASSLKTSSIEWTAESPARNWPILIGILSLLGILGYSKYRETKKPDWT